MMYEAMRDELEKIADVSHYEAASAMRRLRQIEREKPGGDEVARGAIAGSAAGVASRAAGGLMSGDIVKGTREALKAPTVAGKIGKLGLGALRGAGSSMAGSAAFGTTLPFVRRHLDREAEKAKLEDYLGTSKGGTTRRKAKRMLGV